MGRGRARGRGRAFRFLRRGGGNGGGNVDRSRVVYQAGRLGDQQPAIINMNYRGPPVAIPAAAPAAPPGAPPIASQEELL